MTLSIKNLTKIYSGNKKAVDNISLNIEAGEFVAFIGTSGSGKTTALRMINRMIEPTEGSIEMNGKDVRNMNPVELRQYWIRDSTNWINATYDYQRKYCARSKTFKMV